MSLKLLFRQLEQVKVVTFSSNIDGLHKSCFRFGIENFVALVLIPVLTIE